MNWTRRHTLIAGIGLIALTNAIALSGVAWNRSGEPDSVLKLTQRELSHLYRWGLERDAGGLELSIRWRVLTAEPYAAYYADFHGVPEWLDQAKLESLGFDPLRLENARRSSRGYARPLPREALVVLELDGPARQKALERARKRAEEEAAKVAAGTGKLGPGTPAQMAADALKREETMNSRLFAVDAGLDAEALRAKYPDRARYAIMRGNIRAQDYAGRKAGERWSGFIEGLDNVRVNVPLEFRQAFGSVPRVVAWSGALPEGGPSFEVTVAFGKRFEPWIVAAGK